MDPICFVLRGLPGAGKSTLAQRLAQLYKAEIFSATDYFMVDGVYRFNRQLIARAHADCYARFLKAVAFQRQNVVVDNTASELWEYERYVQFAQENDYDVRIVEICCDDEATMLRFHAGNVHGVPLYSIQRMKERWYCDLRAELIHMDDIPSFV